MHVCMYVRTYVYIYIVIYCIFYAFVILIMIMILIIIIIMVCFFRILKIWIFDNFGGREASPAPPEVPWGFWATFGILFFYV